MVAASFLVKSLMLDWREWQRVAASRPSARSRHDDDDDADVAGLGEKHFMENFIDGDLAANNGGWQWTASVGPRSVMS
jgi:deoxyribodipyrimidine photo-lyase